MSVSGAITFVCCIEHGRLEDQTLLMLETLRVNGGRLAGERVLAVIGRWGAPLSSHTIDALDRLGVELVHAHDKNPTTWLNYANKIAAVSIAQELASTPLIAWLDSDVLIAGEPAGLLLDDNVDFGGRCEYLPPVIWKDDSTHLPYFNALCALCGTQVEDLPFIDIEHPKMQIRLNFNSGVFVWRARCSFASAYSETFEKLLRSRLGQYDGHFHTADQVVIAPVLIAKRLSWQHLDVAAHHMVFPGQIDGSIAAPSMAGSTVIHYSGSLTPPHRQRFLERLAHEQPALHAYLLARPAHPRPPPSRWIRALALTLKGWRGMRFRLYAKRLKRVPRGGLLPGSELPA